MSSGSPGPGQYDHGSTVGAGSVVYSGSPEYSVAGRRDAGNKSDTPGPGTYQDVGLDVHKQAASASQVFSGAPRDGAQASANPGPGSYTHDSTLAGEKFSMRGKPQSAKPAETPGPGAHDPGVSGGAPAYSIGGRNDSGPRSDHPGPGAYSHQDPDTHKFDRSAQHAFGSAPRDRSPGKDEPGPGQYMPADPNMTSAIYGFGSSERSKGVRSEEHTSELQSP